MKSYFGYSLAILIPRLMASLTLVLFSHILPPAEIGLYSLVFLFGEYLDTILIRWLRSGYTRFYYNFAAKGQKIDRDILLLTLPGIALSVGFGFVYIAFDPELDTRWAALLALYVVANFVLYQGLQFLNVRGLRKTYVLVEAGRSVVGFALALVLTYVIGPHYEWVMVGSQGLTAVAAVWLLRRMLAEDRGNTIDRGLIRDLIAYSLPLTLSYFLVGTVLIVDRVFLEKLAGPAVLGVYAVSYQLARPTMDVLFNIINTGAYPKLLAAFEAEGDSGAQRVLHQKVIAIGLVTFPVLTFILISAPEIAHLLLKAEYAAQAPILLSVIALASFLRGAMRFLFDQVFQLRRSTMDTVWNSIPPIIAIAAASLLLIPRFGVYGAAYATLISAVFDTVVTVWRSRQQMRFQILGRELGIIALSCAVGGLTIWASSHVFGFWGWIAASALSLAAYALVMKRAGIFHFLRD